MPDADRGPATPMTMADPAEYHASRLGQVFTPPAIFVHRCTHYDGAALTIFPRDPAVEQALAAALNAVDSALGFVCDGRFLFTQHRLEQTPLPESLSAFLPGDGVRSQVDLPQRQMFSPNVPQHRPAPTGRR